MKREGSGGDGFVYGLKPRATAGARVEAAGAAGWRLSVPAGGERYRLAQLDDYQGLGRGAFPHRPPLRLALRARAGSEAIPGTWGFGLWNDPFEMDVSFTARRLRLPALPNAAWFFFASPPNHLSLRDDLPGRGALAGVFRSPRLPAALLAPAAPALALLAIPPAARLLRRIGAGVARQAAVALPIDPTEWHTYRIDWQPARTRAFVDDVCVLDTRLSPHGPLALVIWIDNQYMAFPPDGRVRYGVLPNETAHWIEISDLSIR